MNAHEWAQECVFIAAVTEAVKAGRSPGGSFNNDKACFIRYCEMQRDSAEREYRHDTALYIQECLDDMGMQS